MLGASLGLIAFAPASWVAGVLSQATGGRLVLADAQGPCANAVKDAQRTKTQAETTRTLSILWSTRGLSDRVQQAASWYRALLAQAGAKTLDVQIAQA